MARLRLFWLALCLTLPQIGWAQKRIGIIEYGNETSAVVTIYLEALREMGFVESRNLIVERRFARMQPERFDVLVDELVRARIDVLFTPGHDIAKVAKRVAPNLAVVTAGSEDPVLSGLVSTLRRPGGNVTGVTYMSPEHAPKRLELLKEALPGLSRVAVVWDPGHVDTYFQELEKAARAIGIELQSIQVRNDVDLTGLATALKTTGAQATFIVPGRLTNLESRKIAGASLVANVPAMGAYASQARAGSMLAFGADVPDLLRRAAVQTDKILKGSKAGDLPVEQATRFLLVVNLKTAKALGITIPQSLLLRADEVIQ